jgi:hypothetical protein
VGRIYDFVGHADYYVLSAAALWGLLYLVMVWTRVSSKRFKNEKQQDEFLTEIEKRLQAGDFDGAQAL